MKFESLPRLIHFFGPDGAGKTTQVDLLVDTIRQRGIPVQKYWVRAHHTLAFLLWRFFSKVGFYRTIINPFGPPGRIPAVDRNKVLRWFWSAVEFLGVLPLIAQANYLMRKGSVLVAERYLLDTVTTIAYFLNDFRFLKSWTSSILLRFLPRNAIFIFLDADYSTIFRRRAPLITKPHLRKQRKGYGTIPRCPVEPKSFIDFQRKAYWTLAKSYNPLIIDTSDNSVDETFKMIIRYLRL